MSGLACLYFRALLPAVFLVLAAFTPSTHALEYVLGKGDLLEISVFEHPEMHTTARVSGSGRISLPLIGHVQVAGLTRDEAAQRIRDKLADGYIVNPQVQVFIKEYRELRAVILGQVQRPGLYVIRPDTTLLELISQAGGLTKEAGDLARVKRRGPGGDPRSREFTVDLEQLVEEGDITLNIPIQDGDSIFIVKAGVFYVTGEVRKPDSYKVKDDLTLLKAIALAGGFTDKASKDDVRVIRKRDGKEEVIEKAPMDLRIQPEDVIVVPESFF